jgi:hypothetical protein
LYIHLFPWVAQFTAQKIYSIRAFINFLMVGPRCAEGGMAGPRGPTIWKFMEGRSDFMQRVTRTYICNQIGIPMKRSDKRILPFLNSSQRNPNPTLPHQNFTKSFALSKKALLSNTGSSNIVKNPVGKSSACSIIAGTRNSCC